MYIIYSVICSVQAILSIRFENVYDRTAQMCSATKSGAEDKCPLLRFLSISHPFTAPAVSPSTNRFCAKKNITHTGIMVMIPPAVIRSHCTPSWPIRLFKDTGMVLVSVLVNIMANVYSFQDYMKMYTPVATRQEPRIDRMILKNAVPRLQPSTSAASSRGMGRSLRKPSNSHQENGIVNVV